jgi:hypothetical protein
MSSSNSVSLHHPVPVKTHKLDKVSAEYTIVRTPFNHVAPQFQSLTLQAFSWQETHALRVFGSVDNASRSQSLHDAKTQHFRCYQPIMEHEGYLTASVDPERVPKYGTISSSLCGAVCLEVRKLL